MFAHLYLLKNDDHFILMLSDSVIRLCKFL